MYHPVQSYGGGQLFEDPDFPADNKALFYSERSEAELGSYTWARPHQLVERPAIFVDGTSRRDVIQVKIYNEEKYGFLNNFVRYVEK